MKTLFVHHIFTTHKDYWVKKTLLQTKIIKLLFRQVCVSSDVEGNSVQYEKVILTKQKAMHDADVGTDVCDSQFFSVSKLTTNVYLQVFPDHIFFLSNSKKTYFTVKIRRTFSSCIRL